MSRYQYGGQALIEGVLMRGRKALAVVLRHPDGALSDTVPADAYARKPWRWPGNWRPTAFH